MSKPDIETARLVASGIRHALDALDELLSRGETLNSSDRLQVERLADGIAESAARLADEIEPVKRGKPRIYHVRKALGYTYP